MPAVAVDVCILGPVPCFRYCSIDLTVISQAYIHRWEDFNVHLPASTNAQLISNGYEFTEVPWYPQYDFTRVGPTSAGPTPSVCVSTQADVAAERVDPLGGSIISQERQEGTPELLFLPQPSPQPFPSLPF